MNQEYLTKAAEFVISLENEVFFRKLASYGIEARTIEEAQFLLNRGDEILAEYPFPSPQGLQLKQASAERFGLEVKLAQDGFSEETHRYVDSVLADPDAAAAIRALITAQTL